MLHAFLADATKCPAWKPIWVAKDKICYTPQELFGPGCLWCNAKRCTRFRKGWVWNAETKTVRGGGDLSL